MARSVLWVQRMIDARLARQVPVSTHLGRMRQIMKYPGPRAGDVVFVGQLEVRRMEVEFWLTVPARDDLNSVPVKVEGGG